MSQFERPAGGSAHAHGSGFAGQIFQNPPARVSGRRPGVEALLIAPLDNAADAALSHALDLGGFSFERRGQVLSLGVGRDELPAINAMLATHVPRTLQVRIKAVHAAEAATPEDMFQAFLFAETLPTFFEQSEVAWADDALRNDWLFSVFQPIVTAGTGEVHAFEALIRARNPQTGEIISAGQLLHACERLNLKHQLDQHARASAIRDAAKLSESNAKVFVNFLPNAIYDPDLSLRNTLREAELHSVDLRRLVFEVVETEQIEDPARLRYILDCYRQQGAGVALDDIGSGFSSLQYLTDLLPDYVKIDRHIVCHAVANLSVRHTLESIVGLAHKLNVTVVAEGIETAEEMRVCVEAGADLLQGYFFARPAFPPESVRPGLFDSLEQAA